LSVAVEIVVEDERWANLDVVSDRACNAALREVGLDASRYEVVVLGADDARIAVLNGQFRGLARPTNVLSWPSEERGAEAPGARPRAPVAGELGDIALAWETCNREAEALGWPLDDYVSHLLVHGTLHLLGYDHETEGDAELMEAVEVGVLRELNLPNPYAC
jgi:probable rRNA maturation factor